MSDNKINEHQSDFITKEILTIMAILAAWLIIPMNIILFYIIYINYVSTELTDIGEMILATMILAIMTIIDATLIWAVYQIINMPND